MKMAPVLRYRSKLFFQLQSLTWNYVLSDGDYHETNQVTAQLTERFRQLA